MEDYEYVRMDQAEDRMWWYRALHLRLLDAIPPTRGCRVLDAGCGTGGFLAALGRARPDIRRFGLEWSPAAASRAAAKSGASVARGSINGAPFADGSFDVVVAADVLCHAAVRPDAALAEMRRLLRPKSRLVVNMPAYSWLMSAHDLHVQNARRQTAAELRAMLLGAGFTRVRVAYWNTLLLPLMVARRKLPQWRARHSDVAVFSPWLDAILYRMTALERCWTLPLPAGGSVLAVADRP